MEVEELEGAVCPHNVMLEKIPNGNAMVMKDEQEEEVE